MCAAMDPTVSLSTHSLLPMVSFVDHIDHAEPSASKVVDNGEAPDSNEPEMGRRGSRGADGEVYEGSLVRLRCETVVAAGPGQQWE